jgi:DNA-binding transcriptional MocR family regulator
MTEQDELKSAIQRRVLAAVRRTPGVTANALTLSMSGAERTIVSRSLAELEKRGFVERKGSPSLWYTVEYLTGPKPAKRTASFTTYKPTAIEVARPDALAHEDAPSRRGDELVQHSRPLGTLNDHRNNPMEPDRARAVSQVASVLVDTAKVDADYIKATGSDRSDFLEPEASHPRLSHEAGPAAHNPFPSVVRHRLQG